MQRLIPFAAIGLKSDRAAGERCAVHDYLAFDRDNFSDVASSATGDVSRDNDSDPQRHRTAEIRFASLSSHPNRSDLSAAVAASVSHYGSAASSPPSTVDKSRYV